MRLSVSTTFPATPLRSIRLTMASVRRESTLNERRNPLDKVSRVSTAAATGYHPWKPLCAYDGIPEFFPTCTYLFILFIYFKGCLVSFGLLFSLSLSRLVPIGHSYITDHLRYSNWSFIYSFIYIPFLINYPAGRSYIHIGAPSAMLGCS